QLTLAVLYPPPCRSCPCSLPHGLETSFTRLMRHLLSATSSLDLCVFAFSNQKHRAAATAEWGVAVSILTNKNYVFISGFQIGALRRAGAVLLFSSLPAYVHHKFCVVDSQLVIASSLNWTITAFQSNRENVLVTEEPDLVRCFIQEFEQLWEAYDPSRYLSMCISCHDCPRIFRGQNKGTRWHSR
uniref:Mitochondrial cardiolipin hydrolase n=1 Tax=Scleropages formosus TaxID=113540 RepID=A0A8C9TXV3_SCLFO